ncbi:MAG TPA: hypothetical protein VIX37_14140 [Candidatus Sulfotelmatobacter sp.]
MDANIFLTGLATLAGAGGVWALVKWTVNGDHPAPPPEVPPWQTSLSAQMGEISSQLGQIIEERQAPGPPAGGWGGTVNEAEARAALQPPVDIDLAMFNTFTLAPNTPYRLFPPEDGVHNINIMNYGPGVIFIRADDDPYVGDPLSETLAVNAMDNDIHIPVSLTVLTGAPNTIISTRLSYQL